MDPKAENLCAVRRAKLSKSRLPRENLKNNFRRQTVLQILSAKLREKQKLEKYYIFRLYFISSFKLKQILQTVGVYFAQVSAKSEKFYRHGKAF